MRGLLPLLALALACSSAFGAEPIELPVWPGTAPGSEGQTQKETWEERGKDGALNRAVRQVHTPSLTVYLPDRSTATHVGILVAPGGGFEHVTIDKEGHDIARFLATHGIAGIVLKYRLPKTPGAGYSVDTAFADVTQALRVVRAHAAEWNFDPGKLGMMGFSAGGHLTILAGTKAPPEERPAFLVPMYPAVPADFAAGAAGLPPVFIAQASDDPLMASGGTLKFYAWARAQQGPVELHLFAKGGHGFGLGEPGTEPAAWPALFLSWLGTVTAPAAR